MPVIEAADGVVAWMAARLFPGAYFALVAVFYTWRIIVLRRRRGGVSPVYPGRPGSAPWWHHHLFVLMRLLILLLTLARIPWPALDRWLVPLAPLWHPSVMLSGCLLLLLSFLGVLRVHLRLDGDWRSGMAPEGPARLITEGAYARLRHPSFSLVMLGQAGLFLAIPSLFTLLCLLLGATVLLRQARLEEAQLRERFPEAFAAYAARVPAWPWRRGV